MRTVPTASDAVRAIHVACDTGAKVHLLVQRIPADLAAYAIAFASGLALERGAPACPTVSFNVLEPGVRLADRGASPRR
jgi:hypothetical protein